MVPHGDHGALLELLDLLHGAAGELRHLPADPLEAILLLVLLLLSRNFSNSLYSDKNVRT